jgi:hypothetical protein
MFECVGTMDETGKAFFSQAIPQILRTHAKEALNIEQETHAAVKWLIKCLNKVYVNSCSHILIIV